MSVAPGEVIGTTVGGADRIPVDQVSSVTAQDGVGSVTAVDRVVSVTTLYRVVAQATTDQVIPVVPVDPIAPGMAVDCIPAVSTDQPVPPAAAVDPVVAVSSLERVVEVGRGDQRVVAISAVRGDLDTTAEVEDLGGDGREVDVVVAGAALDGDRANRPGIDGADAGDRYRCLARLGSQHLGPARLRGILADDDRVIVV